MSDTQGRYFVFPLSILQFNDFYRDETDEAIVLKRLDLALNVGIYNAGMGYLKCHGEEEFITFLDRLRRDYELDEDGLTKDELKRGYFSNPVGDESLVLVGAEICDVTLDSYAMPKLRNIANDGRRKNSGPLVRMKSNFFWAALKQARAEEDDESPWPERGISWREFRVLAAILSARVNKAEFAFIGWESIRARASGFARKEEFEKFQRARNNKKPRNLPPLSRKVIRTTCDKLENLGFYARFHLSSGKVGGLMAYSFRHDRDALAKAVCDHVNFRDLAKIREHRAADEEACKNLLFRAKSGNKSEPSVGPSMGPSKDTSPGPT